MGQGVPLIYSVLRGCLLNLPVHWISYKFLDGNFNSLI